MIKGQKHVSFNMNKYLDKEEVSRMLQACLQIVFLSITVISDLNPKK